LARSHAYLEKSPDSLLVVDDRGDIRFANERAREMFDLPETDDDGVALQRLVPQQAPQDPRNVEVAERSVLPAALGYLQALQGCDIVARTRDGEKFTVNLSISPVELKARLRCWWLLET